MTDEQNADETPDEAEAPAPEASETTDVPEAQADVPDTSETTEPDGDTFPRDYVESLRGESAGYRTQLRAVQERLHGELVRATGLLADPADLPFDAAHLEDPEALSAAIEALVSAKPHLKARRFVGDVGQGNRGSANAGVDLLGILRSRA
ncbi:hypothetical protein [uncultured Gordonia sp.]|uniref:hypothetical protein n=1 Tax=uncultured Gordonia sp. TaxID=198437 RepID=UPI002593DD49|nr:hypothetical protein [uncultured Gordonia sp.]